MPANHDPDEANRARASRLQAMQYQIADLELLLDGQSELTDELTIECLIALEPDAIAYDAIMRRHDGNPAGVEHRHQHREQWAFVLPDASLPGHWRVQTFRVDGFVDHFPHATLTDAVRDMVVQGFQVAEQGALDRLSNTAQWRIGCARADLVMQHNTGRMSWDECLARSAALAA